jgi:hypothetical protein
MLLVVTGCRKFSERPGSEGTHEGRRAGSLQLLALYSRLIKVLQRRIELTIKDALDAGSDYGEIATACGVSRQAVRQRWLRRTTDPRRFEQLRPPLRPGGLPGSTSHDQERPRDTRVRLVGAHIPVPAISHFQARPCSTKLTGRHRSHRAQFRSLRGTSPAETMRTFTSSAGSSETPGVCTQVSCCRQAPEERSRACTNWPPSSGSRAE